MGELSEWADSSPPRATSGEKVPRMLAFDASEISVVVARRLRGSDPVLMPPPPQHEGQKGYLGESRGTFGPGCALRRYRERRSSKRTLCRPCRHPGFREKPQRENRSRLSSEGRIARDRRSELSPVLQPGPHGEPPGTLHVSPLSSLLSKASDRAVDAETRRALLDTSSPQPPSREVER